MMDYKTLGDEILSIRRQKKISQALIAKDLGITRITISAVENAKGNVGIKTVMQIADYLGQQLTLSQAS
ncbi:conserved hypothetical protein [Isorropodon fossajaponicum endosymbiont JTNG4]|uniref:helix-turn-helix transcriptional regulator n=1 Tax=Isorropodon fossajaponicum symbiont TaxID=883811 RepID=UPI0019360418|nr:helix-turn-helix transcriptional regulator [Isorropodon fossajaponicum symbiont]BBB23895.1 conserved hypothetical protein [Isorropodon fossajaponicum endosymbiont JTNG4]